MTVYKREDTLVIFALEDEAQNFFHDGPLVFTGVGKVNAAYALTKALVEWKAQKNKFPSLVLNLGSAGSSFHPVKSVINATRYIQRDMDTTAFGLTPYTTISDKAPVILDNGLRIEDTIEGVVGSGDNFVTDHADHPWDLVDMEAYAMAKVCWFENVPFACLKYITDGANGPAATSWEDTLPLAASSLRDAMAKIVA